MLQPLAWHRSCLVNSTRTVEELRTKIEEMKKQLERSDRENRFYGEQIKEAEIAGKPGFDRDRFMKKIWEVYFADL